MKKFKLNVKSGLALAAALALTASCATAEGPTASDADYDALAQKMIDEGFHDKGIVKVAEVFTPDDTLDACDAADVSGHAMDPALAKRLEAENFKTIQWPADGNYLGDWQSGEKIAQSGRGRTWTDQADAANGGNCYNCHQISKEELSFGTIGPSLYNYGKLRGVNDPADPQSLEMVRYTWGKIYNAKAYDACSNMPRFGSHDILTQDQIRDLMALLLDPESPVNE